MKKQTAFALLVTGVLVAACGDSGTKSSSTATSDAGTSATLGPDRTEGNVDKTKLETFNAFLPVEVNGWKKQEPLGYYSGSNASTATATYRRGGSGPAIAVVVTVSTTMTSQTQDLIANRKQADALGFEVLEFSGFPAFAGKQDGNMAGTAWAIVVTNSRMVQAQFNPADGLTRADTRAILEKVDFKGIAAN